MLKYKQVLHSIYTSLLFLDFCIGEKFSGTCGHGSVVMMTHATLGSMSTGRCAQTALQYCEEVFRITINIQLAKKLTFIMHK